MNIVIFLLMVHDVIPVGSMVFRDWYREAAYVYIPANNKAYICKGKVNKCTLLYSTVRNHQDCSKRFTLYYLATCSIEQHRNFPGKHLAALQLISKDYSYTHNHRCL